MDTPTQDQKMPTSTVPEQAAISPEKPQRSRKSLLLFGILGAIIIILLITGAYLLGMNNATKKPVVYQISSPRKLSPTSVTSMWTTHVLKAVGMSFQLPPEIEKLGEWKEVVSPGQAGSVLCFQLPEKPTGLIPKAYAGGIGVCNANNPASFVIGGSSTDFSVGREGLLTDFQGFTEKDGTYSARFVNNQEFMIPLKVEKIANQHSINIIMFKGKKREPSLDIWPTENALVALINTGDKTYRGLTMIANIQKVDEQTFKHILESFRFTK